MKAQAKLLAIGLLMQTLCAHADSLLLKAERIFDGYGLRFKQALLLEGSRIEAIGEAEALQAQADQILDLGDATLLPGLIELHSHIQFQQVPESVVLTHGVTTARDLGGAVVDSRHEPGGLRLLSAGPILTVAEGYPLNVFGHAGHHHGHGAGVEIAIPLSSVAEAQAITRQLLDAGVSVIKVALEPGGESGAPWTRQGLHDQVSWPMLSADMLAMIVATAHQAGKKVSAHLSENQGVKLALAAGVDEWAHTPCLAIDDVLLQQAVSQGVTVISTLDTLSQCPGVMVNARRLAELGAPLLYGAELAHLDIPWGFDAQELQWLMQATGMSPLQALTTVTATAGSYLGLAPLGQLSPDAPADVIAVRGNVLEHIKSLEYPELVMVGGKIISNRLPPKAQ